MLFENSDGSGAGVSLKNSSSGPVYWNLTDVRPYKGTTLLGQGYLNDRVSRHYVAYLS